MEFQVYADELEILSAQPEEVIDWGIHLVQAPFLWKITQGEGMKIAILDTGIDYTHPDLLDNIKGYVDFTGSTRGAMDVQGHGTHVAGIISGVNNGIGVVGVAPKAELYGVKVLGDNGSGSISSIVKGINWAIENDMDILSMSLGCSTDPGPVLHEAIKRARAAGIIIVAASGNESTHCGWPAAYPECMAVGAIDQAMEKASFSNFGPEVDIVAPGVSIYSTYPNGQYARLSGTSMATPIVTGVIALLQAYGRQEGIKMTPDMMMELISQRSVDLGDDGKDHQFGHGLLNVYKLVKKYNSIK